MKQIFYLLRKNFLLSIKRKKWTCFQLFFTPILVMMMLFVLKFIVEKDNMDRYEFANRMDNTWKNKCSADQSPCYEFMYSNTDASIAPFTTQVMNLVRADMAQELGVDESSIKYKVFASEAEMELYMFDHQNVAFVAIGWEDSKETNIELTDATVINYNLYYNTTNADNSPIAWMKQSIDNAALKVFTGTNNNMIKAHMRGFPNPAETEEDASTNVNVYVSFGGRFLALPGLILFLSVMQTMATDKELGLRRGMEVMGMKNYAYLISWFITYLCYSIIVAIVIMLAGVATVAHPFILGNPLYHFINIILFFIALISFGFLFSTLFNTGYAALVSGFVVLAMSDIMNATISQGSVAYSLMKDPVLRHILGLYPPMNFMKVFIDISYKTKPYFNLSARGFVNGEGYGFSDLFVKNHHEAFKIYDVQESYISLLWQILNILLYITLWYFADAISRQKDLFHYCRRRTYVNQKSNLKESSIDENLAPDIAQEYQAAMDFSIPAKIRLVNVCKSYTKNYNIPKIGSKNKVLNGISVCITKPGCYMIIGSNGKSTLFNILNGTENCTFGSCYVEGINVERNPTKVRSKLGMAFEYDFLWQELSAWHHMQLFAELKGIPRESRKNEIEHRLKQVSLYHVRNHPVGSFSGGMKRRLSVALACIGDPPVLLLDLPTLGVDPSSRRKIWALIHELKNNHVIIATSHSLQECENLGTKIGILSGGKFHTFDNSTNLISRYQSGYSLNVVAKRGRVSQAKTLIKSFINSKIQLHSTQLQCDVNPEEMKSFIGLMEHLESNQEDVLSCIEDWNISQITLEEVYKRIMSAEKISSTSKEGNND